MMLICGDCGHVFSDDDIFYEKTHVTGFNVPDGGYDETDAVCPNCHSDAIHEAYECEICGEYHHEDDMIGDICKDCLLDTVKNQPLLVWDYLHDDDCNLENFSDWLMQYRRKLVNG